MTILGCIAITSCFGQLGGKSSFLTVNIPANARLQATGGINTSLTDRDVNYFLSNPSLVSDSLSGVASANYHFYVADIGQASFAYAHAFKKVGTLAFGIQNLDYGNITSYDETGNELGDFSSGETTITVGKSHQVENFKLGINLKTVFSNIAGYRATALLLDVGGVFVHPKEDFTVGIVIKNAGLVLSEYSATSESKVPFDVQLGVTYKPTHMPLRFSVTAYNLVNADVTYFDQQMQKEEPGIVDKVLRRFNFGAELLIHKNVNILAGYNYLVHQELKLENAGGGAGVSLGFSARVKSFEFVFSRSAYVAGTAGYAVTLSANIDKMLK